MSASRTCERFLPAEGGPADSRRRWAIAVTVASLAVYAQSLWHGFAYDDTVVVALNQGIRALGQVPGLFARTEWAGSGIEVRAYRPLTDVTYALNYAVAGLAPWTYHLTNVLLHAVASVLVLYLGLSWGLGAAAAGAGALLFAVHPLHVEAVANVVGRKDLLVTAFLLGMALAHRWALRGRAVRCLVPALAFAAAMLSKENGIVGLGLVAVDDVFTRIGARRHPTSPEPDGPRRAPRRGALCYGLYALLAAAYLAVLWSVTSGVPAPRDLPVQNPAAFQPTLGRLMTATAVVGKGLSLAVLPWNQSPDYSFDAIPVVTAATDPRFLLAVAAVAAALVLGLVLVRPVPQVLHAVVWYVVALLPVSNLLFPIGTIFGERLLYLPSVALSLLAGLALWGALRSAPAWAVPAAAAGLALLLSIPATLYGAAWRDNARLFAVAAAHQPRSAHVHVTLAGEHLERERYDEAISEARVALAIAPESPVPRLILAEALRATGHRPEAFRELASVLRQEPRNPDALYAMAVTMSDMGLLEEASKLWRASLEGDRAQARKLADLAARYFARGLGEKGRVAAELALSSDPLQRQALVRSRHVLQGPRGPGRSPQGIHRLHRGRGTGPGGLGREGRARAHERSLTRAPRPWGRSVLLSVPPGTSPGPAPPAKLPDHGQCEDSHGEGRHRRPPRDVRRRVAHREPVSTGRPAHRPHEDVRREDLDGCAVDARAPAATEGVVHDEERVPDALGLHLEVLVAAAHGEDLSRRHRRRRVRLHHDGGAAVGHLRDHSPEGLARPLRHRGCRREGGPGPVRRGPDAKIGGAGERHRHGPRREQAEQRALLRALG